MNKLAFLFCSIFLFNFAYTQEYGIINNSKSPYVKLKSIDMGDCIWTDGFWAEKFKIAQDSMIPYMGELLCGDIGHGLNNFKIAAGMMKGKHKGFPWHDGDFYKYMEAISYVYSQTKEPKLLTQLDEYIEIIGKAQEQDGYLHTKIQIDPQIDRFENRRYHEMYNSGHLYTSACIHYRLTGKRNFLDIALKNANLLYNYFMPDDKRYARFGFNQTQIMGLVELYRTVGDVKYLKLAQKFIDNRGKYNVEETPETKGPPIGDMVQENTPLREENEAVGHAVLALYYYAGAADVYAETGEKALLDALDRLWENVTNKKMYVTGACGQTHHGVSSQGDLVHEAFINEYMMPNSTAYNETCANIANAMFSYRMMGIHGESKYIDIVELVLYNSALSGISIEGKDYFYANPLRVNHNARDYSKMSNEFSERQHYLECFCCPPNLVRTICKVSGWAYSKVQNGIAVNLYGGNKLYTKMLDGSALSLEQKTNYPWEGDVKITIQNCKKEPFKMMLRIPDWALGSTVLVNGAATKVDVKAGSYATIERTWKKGDVISLNLPMDVKLVEGNSLIEEVRNQVAIKRGPVVYCVESPDLPKDTKILDVYLPASSKLTTTYRPNFLGGLSTICGDVMLRKDYGTSMYNTLNKAKWETYQAQFIPYFAWTNRGKAEMTVWMPVIWGTN